MKKIFTFILASVTSMAAFAAGYTTAGDNSIYTFADLAKIAESGVTVKKGTQIYTVSSDIEIAATDLLKLESGDVVKLADAVEITVRGEAFFEPLSSAMITRLDDLCEPKGINVKGDGSIVMRNVVYEYAQIRTSATTSCRFKDCTFRYNGTKASTSGTLILNNTDGTTSIENCRFIEGASAAISQAANAAHPLNIENCYFYHNTTENANRPQINISNPGANGEHYIAGNMIIGDSNSTKVGGIAVSDLIGSNGGGKTIILNNTVFNCRYGVTAMSASATQMVLEGNSITHNCNETNPNNGGSGISIYGPVDVYATGNLIEGNLWGVTIIGKAGNVNFGKTDDPSAEDYNPGNNVFKSNGNGGVDYDFYNNSSNAVTCYAQGNVWNVAEQDSVSVSKVVWDKYDTATLGEVIFTSANKTPSNVESVTQSSNNFTYDAQACEVKATNAAPITVYSMTGTVAKMSSTPVVALKVDELVEGVYVARNENTGDTVKFQKK